MRYPITHILLAEDDLDQAFLFGHILAKVDPVIRLSTVHDGDGLLDFLRLHCPDLLFLDLNMPCLSGLKCLEAIRREEACRNLPVVVYSSSCRQSDIRDSYHSHADLYMVKPFCSDHLVNALEAILKMEWKENASSQKLYFINNKFVPFTATL